MSPSRPQSMNGGEAGAIGQLLVVLPDVSESAVTPSRNQFSSAIAAFLEMYGFGCHVSVAPGDALAMLMSRKWAAAIVLNQSDWAPIANIIDIFEQQTGAYFLEGPISESLASRLGVRVAPAADEDIYTARIPPGALCEYLQSCFDGYIRGDEISLAPITSSVGRIDADASGKKFVREEAVQSPLHEKFPAAQNILGADEVLLALKEGGGAILGRKGKAILAGIPLFNLICQRLGAPSFPAPWRRAAGERNGENLDLLILLSLAQTAASSGTPLVSIDPWPDGVAYPLTLRHDVDRPVADADWERLLNWQDQLGVRPTWYYLKSTIDQKRISETAARKHEIALHYTNLESKGAAECEALLGAAQIANVSVIGASCHGGNYHGASDLAWLEKTGFQYAEVLTRCALFPFRGVTLHNDNAPAGVGGIWAAARHLSVDKKMSPPEADFDYGARTLAARRRLGAHAVIMNHPDINFDATVAAVDLYRGAGVEFWTQGEAIKWWRDTHLSGAVRVNYACQDGKFKLQAVHHARRSPVLRVWADVDAPEGAKKSGAFGPVHTVFPAGRTAQFSYSREAL